MIRTHLSFKEFYQLCKETGSRKGFHVIITLVARYADAPRYYDELMMNWSSFHDLTGDNVAFLFADTSKKEIASNEVFAWWQSGKEYQTPPGMLVENPEKLLLFNDYDWGRSGEVVIAEELEDFELKKSHTLRVRELITALELCENDVPCLHFLFIDSNTNHFIPLENIKGSLYSFLKKIMGEWHNIFNEAEKKRIEKRKLAEEEHRKKSNRGTQFKIFKDAENRIKSYFISQQFESEANSILDKIKNISENQNISKETFSLIRELRKKYPQKENQMIFADFNTLVDLAPKVNKLDYLKSEGIEAKDELDKKLIETISQFSGKPHKTKQSQELWDVFIAHAGSDIDWAEILYEHLTPALKTFLDSRCLLPGDFWDDVLAESQRNSLITVLLVSAATKEAFYAREEIATAIQQARDDNSNHRVIPLMLPGAADLYGLKRIHHISLNSKDEMESAAKKIINTYNRIYKV